MSRPACARCGWTEASHWSRKSHAWVFRIMGSKPCDQYVGRWRVRKVADRFWGVFDDRNGLTISCFTWRDAMDAAGRVSE